MVCVFRGTVGLEGLDPVEEGAGGPLAVGVQVHQRAGRAGGVPFLAGGDAGMAADADIQVDDQASWLWPGFAGLAGLLFMAGAGEGNEGEPLDHCARKVAEHAQALGTAAIWGRFPLVPRPAGRARFTRTSYQPAWLVTGSELIVRVCPPAMAAPR